MTDILVLCGPAGAGKTTLSKILVNLHPEDFAFGITHTSRAPRPGEVDGADYHFKTREEMQTMIAAGEFVEHTEYKDNIYGLTSSAVESAIRGRADGLEEEEKSPRKKVCMLVLTMDGCMTLKQKWPGRAKFVCILPPETEGLLADRLRARGDSEDAVQRSVAEWNEGAKKGLWEKDFFDAVIVNGDIEEAKRELLSFVIAS